MTGKQDRLWVLCIHNGGGEQRCEYGFHALCSRRAKWAETEDKRRVPVPED